MAQTLIDFIPGLFCLFWVIIISLMSSRTDTFFPILFFSLIAAATLFVQGLRDSQQVSTGVVVACTIILQFLATNLIPSAMGFIMRLNHEKFVYIRLVFWLFLSLLLTTSSIMLYFLDGPSVVNAAYEVHYPEGLLSLRSLSDPTLRMFFILLYFVYPVFVISEFIWFLVRMIHYYIQSGTSVKQLFAFLFKGGTISTKSLLQFTVLLLVFPVPIRVILPMWLCDILLVMLLTFFFAVSLFVSKEELSIPDIFRGFRFNSSSAGRGDYSESIITEHLPDLDEEALRRVQLGVVESLNVLELQSSSSARKDPAVQKFLSAGIVESRRDKHLLAEFNKVMAEDRLFLKPGLTLNEVADRMHTNKTYLSKMINGAFSLGFPEVLNSLRIDYAKQYMLANPDATQYQIASECGFLSASAFNSVFKKLTGITPKLWLAGMSRS